MDRIRNIVVPTDFSALAEAAAARAATLALVDGASVHLVHAMNFPIVTSPYHVPLEPIRDELRQEATERMENCRKAVEDAGVKNVTSTISKSADAVHAVAHAVDEHQADLVVMGTHGHEGLKHAFLGSVAERTLRTVDCPVLAVKETLAEARKPISKIVLAVDFSEDSDRAAETAAFLARRLDASLEVIHAIDMPGDLARYSNDFALELTHRIEAIVEEKLGALQRKLEPDVPRLRFHTGHGEPAQVIADLARETSAQLIVMGTRGNTGVAHVLLGSVAERTLRRAPCAVLALKSVAS